MGDGRIANVRNPGILIADDMALILTLLKFELESRGFNVWLAVDGDDAIDLYRRHRHEIDLVLLDEQMPGLDGPHTLQALRQIDPDVLACFMTGSGGTNMEVALQDCAAAWIFRKPFRPAEVADLLQRLAPAPNFPSFDRDWKSASEREMEPCTPRGKLASSPL
jgi:CheY-like chemotaxis protein